MVVFSNHLIIIVAVVSVCVMSEESLKHKRALVFSGRQQVITRMNSHHYWTPRHMESRILASRAAHTPQEISAPGFGAELL